MFRIEEGQPFAKYSFRYPGEEFKNGFGRQILGDTWSGHHGKNHRQSSRLLIQKAMASHPILRGVKHVWAQSGGYQVEPNSTLGGASRQTELSDRFPTHVVADWLGNTEAVARAHYLQTHDAHFQAALAEDGGAESGAAGSRSQLHRDARNSKAPRE